MRIEEKIFKQIQYEIGQKQGQTNPVLVATLSVKITPVGFFLSISMEPDLDYDDVVFGATAAKEWFDRNKEKFRTLTPVGAL